MEFNMVGPLFDTNIAPIPCNNNTVLPTHWQIQKIQGAGDYFQI